ncbi:MAG TPA: diguanylate cyclase, partial [Thermoanaerobaculia bacterium]|nr:diguanylate cyclase [Thermoanaerobaculia bacterium]
MKRAVLLLFLALAARAGAEDRGLPLITTISPEARPGGSQSFAVTQDPRGILFVGNLAGVLVYDGAFWRLVALPNDSAVYSIATNDRGVVAAGGVAELGFLARDARGTLAYQSLVPRLPQAQRNVGDVHGICAAGREFTFVTDNSLISWDGGAPRVLVDLHGRPAPARCTNIDNATYVYGEPGLQRLLHGILLPAGIDGKTVDAAVDGGSGRIIAAVRNEGFVAIANGVPSPFALEASAWMKGKTITDALRLRDGRLIFTTREDGVLLLHPDGTIDEIIDRQAGLPDEVLRAALVDREGALWLVFEGTLARVDLSSPVTIFDARRGVRGSGRSTTRIGDTMWFATSHGVYSLRDGQPAVHHDALGNGAAWRIASYGDEILAGTSDGLFAAKNDVWTRIAGTEGTAVYSILPSQRDQALVWLGTKKGLATMRRVGDAWRYQGLIEGTPPYSRRLVEQNGVLWSGSTFAGITRVEVGGKGGFHVSHFGSGEMAAAIIANRVVFVRSGGEILQPASGAHIVPDALLGNVRAANGFFDVAEDKQGNVWVNSQPPRVLRRHADGTYDREGQPLVSINGNVQSVNVDSAGNVWFNATRGIYLYTPTEETHRDVQPTPLIGRVLAGNSTPVADGLAGIRNVAELPYQFRRLRIEFAPASYRPGVAYQYKLDPLDSAWSNWISDPFIDYTHLPNGSYTLRIRARNANGTASAENAWSFTVLPPWYRTQWAYALAILAAIALVIAVVRLRTRALQRQAERLRELVELRTDALRLTVRRLRETQSELVQNNELLEQANDRLERLSLLDELTGIPNRRYFERVLLADHEAAAAARQPLALIFLDLDHFKRLNDAAGHPAGDACLRQVGRFLAQKIRRSGDMVTRSGDVVARIGGEEFAILLADTDTAGAYTVAESLRAGIAALSIDYEEKTLHITASCGIAALLPGEGGSADALIRAADQALYSAKAAGRNCVRVDNGPVGA